MDADDPGPRVKGFRLDAPGSDQWALQIGKLIVNFGALELLSHACIENLATDRLLHDEMLAAPLGRRIDLIAKLISRRAANRGLKQQAAKAWESVRALSEIRNAVAHNPIVFGWTDPSEEGVPDFITIPNLRKGTSQGPSKRVFLDMRKIVESLNLASSLAQELDALLDRLTAPPKMDIHQPDTAA